jgi:hypothetical protein
MGQVTDQSEIVDPIPQLKMLLLHVYTQDDLGSDGPVLLDLDASKTAHDIFSIISGSFHMREGTSYCQKKKEVFDGTRVHSTAANIDRLASRAKQSHFFQIQNVSPLHWAVFP